MHILFLHQAYLGPDEPGGTRHLELGKYLVQKGHRFSVIASTLSYLTGKKVKPEKIASSAPYQVFRAYTIPGIHRSYLHRGLSFVSFMISSFLKGLGRKQIDLVWGTSPPLFQGLPAWLLARIKKVRFVLEIRDLWPAFAVDLGVLKNPLLITLAEWVERFLYFQADHLLINSPAYRDHLLQAGVADHKITLIANGVDVKELPEEGAGERFRKEFDLKDKYLILYAGAHGPANDLTTVLKAAELLRQEPDLIFVLVGDGIRKDDLIREAEERGLSNVVFIPPQPKTRMPEVLAASNACLAILKDIPMFSMTYPNKVFDYMAASKPTVLAIDGVIRDVVETSQGGIFVSPGDPEDLADKVKYLADHPEAGKQMGTAARMYVKKHFDRQQQAADLEDLLEKLSIQAK